MYVVYPAALFDGWEVVKEGDDESAHFNTREEAIAYAKARATMNGEATVRLENWYGDTESTLEVRAQSGRRLVLSPEPAPETAAH